ncbi:MAG: hypothetical protein QHC88_10930 [Achromobacter sp.]|uniref:hypothetical protein n=1 Tax=Achromobacter sp. TaxID=134375 RepID=UPI0029BF75A9|nr:hypothetical protein [Achromobacter sp.]MDX3985755.1 hypothetical protein [Achromobacter sp.]
MSVFHQITAALMLPLLGVAIPSYAQGATKLPESANQHAYEASRDIYTLLKENDKFRVMLATWKPGQSDEWHTHHGDLVNYNLTDCKLRGELPDGRVATLERKKGEAGFNIKNDVHKVTNVGDSECVLLIVERK